MELGSGHAKIFAKCTGFTEVLKRVDTVLIRHKATFLGKPKPVRKACAVKANGRHNSLALATMGNLVQTICTDVFTTLAAPTALGELGTSPLRLQSKIRGFFFACRLTLILFSGNIIKEFF